MKIALIGRYGEGEIVAGPERVARELYSELKNNYQVVFIEYYFSGYKYSSLYKKIFGKETPENSSILRLGILPFLRLLIKGRFEIIHIVNSQRFILFLFLIKPFIQSKLVATLHGFLKFENPKKNFWMKRYFIDLWVEKLLIEKSDVLFFPSKLLYETFNGYYKISEERCKIIPNGVSSIFNKEKSSYPSIYDKFKLVFFNGSESSINRCLIELLLVLQKVKPGIELYIIGRKVELKVWHNIEIEFVDSMTQSELVSFFRDKHFVIKGPAYDSFSLFVVEGMLRGLIPIVNEKIGIKDFINNEINGFIYDSESPDDLANLLNRIFDRKYDLQEVSANAKRIYEDLNWDKIANKYMQAYQSVL